jgi:probable rRNA maturation factor
MIHLEMRNESARKRLYRRSELTRLAEDVCRDQNLAGEVELSLLLCDDAFIAGLNKTYRGKSGPTDVLSFAQPRQTFHEARVLGDIVISLETVERACDGVQAAMRAEVRLLFCHGLLHLLGYTHGTEAARRRMAEKQAQFLGLDAGEAWHHRGRAGHASRKEA